MSANRHPVFYGYWIIAAAFAAQFVSTGVQNYVFGAFMTPMIDEFGWTRTEFTLPRTLGQLVLAATGLVIGSRVDRLGGRPFMLAGVAVLTISLVLLGRIWLLWHWILLNGLILTVGAALIGNLVVNVTLSKWFVELRGRAISLAAMGVSLAGIVLTPATTLAIDRLGWRSAWDAIAVCALLMTLPCALVMRRAPEDQGLHPDGRTDQDVAAGRTAAALADFQNSLTRRQALSTLTFYVLVLAFGLFSINIGVMLIQTIPYLTTAGFDRTAAALAITVASVPAFLSKPMWGMLIDRFEPRRLAATGAALTGASLVVIAGGVGQQHLGGVYAGYFLLGCGWGGMIPLQEVIWARIFGRRHLGAVRSAALPFSLTISAVGPVAVSWCYDRYGAYEPALAAVALANLVSAIMLLLVRQPAGGPGRHPAGAIG